jgi:hypothetical protein
MLQTVNDKSEGEQLLCVDMKFLKAVYPSGHICFLLWKWSESDTILPEKEHARLKKIRQNRKD